MRNKKVFKLDFFNSKVFSDAYLAFFDQPDEARIGVGPSTFISVKENGIFLGGGTPSQVTIQGLSLSFAGLLKTKAFPLSLIPSTIGSPNPMQTITPPFVELIPTIQAISIASTMIAVRL